MTRSIRQAVGWPTLLICALLLAAIPADLLSAAFSSAPYPRADLYTTASLYSITYITCGYGLLLGHEWAWWTSICLFALGFISGLGNLVAGHLIGTINIVVGPLAVHLLVRARARQMDRLQAGAR